MRRVNNDLSRYFCLLIGLCAVGCTSPAPDKHPVNRATIVKDTILPAAHTDSQYSAAVLTAFLDSIGALNNEQLRQQVAATPEHQFRSIKPLNKELSAAEFRALKKALAPKDIAMGTWLDTALARQLFPFPIDSNAIHDGSVAIGMRSFDRHRSDFNEFVVYIGDASLSQENDLYFFKGRKIIAWQHNYSRYGLELDHFKDADGKTVAYYKENFGSGTGIWQFNYYCYKYDGDHLLPALNLLENGNLNGWGTDRQFWLEASMVQQQPLRIKFVYHFELADSTGQAISLYNDSTVVPFYWDKQQQVFAGRYPEKFREAELYTYYLSNTDAYSINVYYKLLRAALASGDAIQRSTVLHYLNGAKNRQGKNLSASGEE